MIIFSLLIIILGYHKLPICGILSFSKGHELGSLVITGPRCVLQPQRWEGLAGSNLMVVTEQLETVYARTTLLHRKSMRNSCCVLDKLSPSARNKV
jgi:hypothetical protein